MDTLSGVV